MVAATAHGQEGRVEILNADEWSFDAAVNGAQLLRGNVRFKHANALMRCDSAYLFEDERVDAFGHVTIDQGDTRFPMQRAIGGQSRWEGREWAANRAHQRS